MIDLADQPMGYTVEEMLDAGATTTPDRKVLSPRAEGFVDDELGDGVVSRADHHKHRYGCGTALGHGTPDYQRPGAQAAAEESRTENPSEQVETAKT